MSDATILRNGSPDSPFTVIPNACLQDYSLSLAAHAVLLRILSLPPHWTFHKSWAQQRYGIGRDKLDGIIKELVKAEYCRFKRLRNPDGTKGASCFTFTNTKGVFPPGACYPQRNAFPRNPDASHVSRLDARPGRRRTARLDHGGAPCPSLIAPPTAVARAYRCRASGSRSRHRRPNGPRPRVRPACGRGTAR